MITCRKCGQQGEASRRQSRECKSCYNAYMRSYYKANKAHLQKKERERYLRRRSNPDWVESERRRGREYWAACRHEAIMKYGGYICACCGETTSQFLTIDHVENNGAEHRREMGYENNGKGASSATLIWLRKNNYPEGFQVLCMNCNFGKQINGGICPHQSYKKTG